MPSTMDETGDVITDRGFRHTQPVEGVEGYGGQIMVYESSGAAAPRVWISIEDVEGHLAVHLEEADARKFAANILRVCDNHYQHRAHPNKEIDHG